MSFLKDTQNQLVEALKGAKANMDIDGNASTADKLNTPREIQVDLESESPGLFDGSINADLGIKSILSLKNGGTGGKTAEEARINISAAPDYTYGTNDLISGVSELATGRLYFVYE